jgi:hypothetical protein
MAFSFFIVDSHPKAGIWFGLSATTTINSFLERTWWYLVDHNESDPNSPASLLGIGNEMLQSFLKEANKIYFYEL